MKIIICIKQVPDTTEIRFDAARRTLQREGVRLGINPFDKPALALGVRLKERFGADVTVVTMGPPQAREVLFDAVACGLDRAVHLCHPAFAGADTLATARTLAAFCRRQGFDLILCGKYTVDGETAQVGPELAELLDIPHIAGVGKADFAEDGLSLRAERESDEGHDVIACALPCLLTAAEHLMMPVVARKAQLDAAREVAPPVLGPAELGLRDDECGAAGSPTWVAEIRELPRVERPKVQLFTGTPGEIAAALAQALRAEVARLDASRPPLLPVPPARAQVPAMRDVFVVVETTAAGHLCAGTVELLGEAAALAVTIEGAVVAVVVGPCAAAAMQALGPAGADEVLHLLHPALAPYSSEAHAAALDRALQERHPQVVLFSSTERGRDLAPRLAARAGLGLTGDAVGHDLDGEGRLVQLKPAFGGQFVAPILSRTVPAMATVRPGVFPRRAPDPGRRARLVQAVLHEDSIAAPRARLVHSEITVDEEAERLLSSRVVVGVGMGIGDPAHLPALRELAHAAGGVLCATRRVTDKGWMPRQLQVGLTGKIIAPDIYLAVGIRGVNYHAIGIGRARVIIAINKDEKAQIFGLASYGAVGDWAELVPPLTRALAEAPR